MRKTLYLRGIKNEITASSDFDFLFQIENSFRNLNVTLVLPIGATYFRAKVIYSISVPWERHKNTWFPKSLT